MSLLFDQNLSRRLPALLAAEFPGSEQVLLAGLATADDRTVWAYAVARELAIASKDSDFRDLSAALGSPPKVIWLRVGNGPTRVVEGLLRARAADVRAFLSDPTSRYSSCHSPPEWRRRTAGRESAGGFGEPGPPGSRVWGKIASCHGKLETCPSCAGSHPPASRPGFAQKPAG